MDSKVPLEESNVEQQFKLTFKLPKNSTSSPSKSIFPFHAPKPQPLLSTHHVPSRVPSFIFLSILLPPFKVCVDVDLTFISIFQSHSLCIKPYPPFLSSIFLSLSASLSMSFQIICMSWFIISKSII